MAKAEGREGTGGRGIHASAIGVGDIRAVRDKLAEVLGPEAFQEYWKGMNGVLMGKVREERLHRYAADRLDSDHLALHNTLVSVLKQQTQQQSGAQPFSQQQSHPSHSPLSSQQQTPQRGTHRGAALPVQQQLPRLLRPLQPFREHFSWEHGGGPSEYGLRGKPQFALPFARSARGIPTGNVEHGFAFPQPSWVTARLRTQAREHKLRAVGEQCADILCSGLKRHMQQLLSEALQRCRAEQSELEDAQNDDMEEQQAAESASQQAESSAPQRNFVVTADHLSKAAAESSHSLGGDRDFHLASLACIASENACSDLALSSFA